MSKYTSSFAQKSLTSLEGLIQRVSVGTCTTQLVPNPNLLFVYITSLKIVDTLLSVSAMSLISRFAEMFEGFNP